MSNLFANSADPDQTPHYAASDLGLHGLPITRLGVARLKWVLFSGRVTGREPSIVSITRLIGLKAHRRPGQRSAGKKITEDT